MKQVIFGIIAVAAILGGAIVFGKDDTAIIKEPSNHFAGLEDAEVVLVEYGDFSCPACAAFHPLVDQVKQEYADKIRFEFRHFALLQNLAPHRAAEAAGKQGKFFEMHDLLFERQSAWRAEVRQTGHGGAIQDTSAQNELFEQYAEEIGLDVEQYKADFALSSTLGTVNADTDRAREDGATATPTFMLNGVRIDDSSTVDTIEEFRTLIDEELAKVAEASTDEPATEENTPATETEAETVTDE